LVNVIIIVSVPRIRAEEGPPGIASVVWATCITAYCVITDRVVAWGKREEEERLTGRPESRRTLREWLSVLAATTILVIYILITILMTATLILRARDASLEMDGERYFVDGDKYQVHLACVGELSTDKNNNHTSTPTILLEAAEEPLEFDFEHWAYSAYQNGTIERYCYWDRPGYGWSDNAPSPHSAGMTADNLAEALAVAGELHEDLLHRLASPSRGFLLWAWGIISPLGIDRIGGAVFRGRTREDRVYGREATQGGKFIKAALQENLVADSLSKNEVASARTIQNSNTPLVVVSSGISVRKDEEWGRKQKDLTNLTNNLISWDVVNKAPHHVWDTLEGRTILEKRLGQLVKSKYKAVEDGFEMFAFEE
jgi:hypothetical protein